MGILVFAAAAFLSLPKQFVTVYIGVILEKDGTGEDCHIGFTERVY